MANILNVPHYQQKDDRYCLAACAQMVLAYWGIRRSQEDLARQLGLRIPLGAPAANLLRLRSPELNVACSAGSLEAILRSLDHNVPIIAFVQAGELPHWRGHYSQHAVVVVDAVQQAVQILDPAAEPLPISIPIGDFLLAWQEMDNLYAVITRRG